MRLRILAALGCLVLAGCASPASAPPATATPSPIATASAPVSGGIELRRIEGNIGCDTIQVPYPRVTFDIDPDAADHVTAVTDDHVTLKTFWADGFVGGSADDLVIRDPNGQVVANSGAVLEIPVGAFPRLNGYFVCPAADALYVFLTDPS